MNKIKVLRGILVILIIINCMVIFKFSAEQSEKSDQTSGIVIDTIIELNPKTRNLNQEEKEKAKENIVTPIRKTAHFTIYTSLGMLLFLCAKTFEGKDKKRALISFLLAFLYACTDELHQVFVPGRSGEFKDVCIDSSGALTGILIVYLVWYLVKIKNLHKISKKSQKDLKIG